MTAQAAQRNPYANQNITVDRYLKPDQFLEIAKFTGTTRVVLGRPGGANGPIPWQMYQAPPDVNVEVRVADPRLLHDRYIVGETAVYQLGCSLNASASNQQP